MELWSKPRYTLFKSPISADIDGCKLTQDVVRFAHACYNRDIRPTNIVERQYPMEVDILPSIFLWDKSRYLKGIDAIMLYYEAKLQLTDLTRLARQWSKEHPNYRINENLSKRLEPGT